MKHIFIVGSKGIPNQYGGFETFAENITAYRKSDDIKYYVSVIKDPLTLDPENVTYEYNGAFCFCIVQRIKSAAKAIFYDVDSIKFSLKYIKEHNIENPILYICACRIGPYMRKYVKKVHKLGGVVYMNPDGQEWKRSKWNKWVKKYWKYSEKKMVKHADLVVCDSMQIEKYVKRAYKKYNPKTKFIAYGAETWPSVLANDDPKVVEWFDKHDVKPAQYYLTVGRFVPENNYETIFREFMKSNTKKDLVVITDHEHSPYLEVLNEKIHFTDDPRIKLVGTLYEHELLKKVRENAFGYIHGHSVGGTNPSLLEALGRTDLNLVYDVSFNKEVAGDGAIYWTEEYALLRNLINKCDTMPIDERYELGLQAKARIDGYYNWDRITDEYEELFLGEKENADS